MKIVIIDIVFIGIMILFTLHSAIKGFIKEIMSLAAVVLGIISAMIFFRAGAGFIRASFTGDIKTVPEILAFIIIFFIVFGVIKLLQIMLKGIIDGIRLGWLDHLLGSFLGCLEGIIVISLTLFVINILPFIDSEHILNGSFFSDLLLPFVMGKQKEFSDIVAVGKTAFPVLFYV